MSSLDYYLGSRPEFPIYIASTLLRRSGIKVSSRTLLSCVIIHVPYMYIHVSVSDDSGNHPMKTDMDYLHG